MRIALRTAPLLLLAASCTHGADGFGWEDPIDTTAPDSRDDGSCASALTLRASMRPSDGFLSAGDTRGFAAVRPDGDTLSAWLFSAEGNDAGWYTNAALPAGVGTIAEAEIRPLGEGDFAALARTAGLPTGADLSACDADAEAACLATQYGAMLAPAEGSGSGAAGSGETPDCTETLQEEITSRADACFAAEEAECRRSGVISDAEIAAAGSCLDAMNDAEGSPELDALFTRVADRYVACMNETLAITREATEATDLARQRCEEATSQTSGSLFFARIASGTLRAAFTDTGLLPADGLSLVHDVEMAATPAGLLVALVGAPTAELGAVEVRTALLDPATGAPTATATAVATDGCTLDREARDLTLTGAGDNWFLLGSSLSRTGVCVIPLDASGARRAAPVRLLTGAGVDYAASFAEGSLWVARGTPMPATPVELLRLDADGSGDSVELISAPFTCPLTSLKESAVQVAEDGVRIAYTAVCDDNTKQFYLAGRTTAGRPLSTWVATVDSTRNALFPGGSPERFNFLYDATTDAYRIRAGSCEGR